MTYVGLTLSLNHPEPEQIRNSCHNLQRALHQRHSYAPSNDATSSHIHLVYILYGIKMNESNYQGFQAVTLPVARRNYEAPSDLAFLKPTETANLFFFFLILVFLIKIVLCDYYLGAILVVQQSFTGSAHECLNHNHYSL